MGLIDFLQSLSNTAASNVSGPVDAINWALGKAGLPVSNAPVGGSEWMQRKGYTKPVEQSTASILGETAGLLSPTLLAAKAPQVARGLLQGAENLAAPRTLRPQAGAIVWHGSPYRFDKFDASKIGTGEGAQAYGHGLYLAESPDVAKSYRDVLGGLDKRYEYGGRVVDQRLMNNLERNAFDAIAYGQTPEQALTNFSLNGVPDEALSKMEPLLKEFHAKGVKVQDVPRGDSSLYKVDLPDEQIAKMLDWDKPMTEQSDFVKKAFGIGSRDFAAEKELFSKAKKLGVSPQDLPEYKQLEAAMDAASKYRSETGASFYSGGNPADRAAEFKSLGIPGIRYLDGGSRGLGDGTSNFVIFPGNEGLLQILERNGAPL